MERTMPSQSAQEQLAHGLASAMESRHAVINHAVIKSCICEAGMQCLYHAELAHGTRTAVRAPDPVNHPPHYKAKGLEAIDVMEAFAPTNIHRASALKYLLRAGRKSSSPVEDLQKAKWYIERELAALTSTVTIGGGK